MKTVLAITAAVLTGALGVATAQSMQMSMKPSGSASSAAAPMVNGEILKLDPKTGVIVLRHGEIANLEMSAMTMGYPVADKKMLKGLKVGDKVEFQAAMIKGAATVTKLKLSR